MVKKTEDYNPFSKFHDFESPIHVIWRKGTADDPYIDRVDVTKVVNQRLVLLEVPDSINRVKIPNMKEINYDSYLKHSLDTNEFYVDYTNGFVYTHSSVEGKTLTCVYKGRGLLLYPSQRVVHWDGTGGYESLESIIDDTRKQVEELISHTEDFDKIMKEMTIAITDAKNTVYYVNLAISNAEQATADAIKAYESTVMNWKPKVKDRDELEKEYPLPELGWTVYVTEENTGYRYDGIEWIPILSINDMINKADENSDGLMSKEDYKKLKGLTVQSSMKTIVFVAPPNEITEGKLPVHFVSPIEGKIRNIEFSFSDLGTSDSKLIIEKSKDYTKWNPIVSEILVKEDEYYKNIPSSSLINSDVELGDKIRVIVTDSGMHKNMTININVELD